MPVVKIHERLVKLSGSATLVSLIHGLFGHRRCVKTAKWLLASLVLSTKYVCTWWDW